MSGSKGGGNDSHRPDCKCFACTRKKEAIARAAGNPASGVYPAQSPVQSQGLTPQIVDADILEVPGRSMRDRVGQWMELRREDPSRTNLECAKLIGIAPQTLNTYISKAHREGWLRFSEPLARIEHEIIPQTLDNLSHYLSIAGGRDKQVTIEVAKGVVFKQYLDSKGISEAPQMVLALKIETIAPEGSATPIKVGSGHVVGAPRTLSLPVIDVVSETEDLT